MAIRSSEISKTEYEVFLSFRGPDTRRGFTDVLYNHLDESGIQVFRDDDELEAGDKIESILEAITNSKICVPIFSKSFASSAWCLREVAKMVELNKDIVPIFYDVTPDDVKLKTPLYVDQMKKYGREHRVEEWEKALVEVGRIKGRELKESGYVEFIKKFKTEISLKLRVKQKQTIKHFVEMPDEVEEALKLLEIGSVEVRFLGMYGMGGVGKTTLAKIIFNRISSSFDSCSFLANIQEERSHNGLESLRAKLLQDLHAKEAVRKNMNIRMKSVLIVLDDVGERSHIEELVGDWISFGPRSRIIITTRDKRALLMNVAEASSSSEVSAKMSTTCISNMEVKGMNPEQAMQLFSRHAFGSDHPPEDYTSLSKDAISISGGLPLALEVIGSLLYGMSIEAWKDKVSILKTIPAKDVQKKLMISYDTLEDNVKEIYLDIACFFIQEDKSNPIYMWEACGFGPNWAVQILLSMSLIKITDDGMFWMHDQLRDLGREIVRIKGNNSPTSREGSRIRTYEEALSIQKRNKEKDVVGLRVHGVDDNLTKFSNFECLRFLQVLGDPTFYHRKFWQLSTNLTWLSLMLNKPKLIPCIGKIFYPIYRNRDSSYLMKLVVLDLSGSNITDSWDGWILIQELRRLKVLNLTKCKNLTRTPNFSKMEALEKLILYHCKRLTKLDNSIGKLQKLKYLNLQKCYNLKKLPEEVGNLKDLEQLNISKTRVSKLPDSIGKLKNLWSLDFEFAYSLKELPATIGLLVNLKHLRLSSPVLDELPDSIGDLISLVNLDLCSVKKKRKRSKCCRIKELPSSITRLKKLERLNLHGCQIKKLPDDLGNLDLLVELDLSFTDVTVVPESIGDLTRLQVINLCYTPVSVLPATIAQLSLLKTLDLSECSRIERVSKLPTSLTDLKLNVCSLRQYPDLSILNQLREFKLDGSSVLSFPFKFDAMEKLLSLEILDLNLTGDISLPVEFSALTRLKSLALNCSTLKCVPPFPSSLQSLTLRYIGRTTELCLSNLNNLSKLELEYCWMEGENDNWEGGIDNLEGGIDNPKGGIDNLEGRNDKLEGGIDKLGVDKLESLISLSIFMSRGINKFPDISRLKHLEELDLLHCKNLVEIPGLNIVVSLKRLNITYCESVERLESVKNLRSLSYVKIKGCKNFRGIQGLEELSVSQINISQCKCKNINRWVKGA